MTIPGLDHVDGFDGNVRHHEAGTVPPTVMWGTCPTQFDASQSAGGKHTAFMWEKLPYALFEGAGDYRTCIEGLHLCGSSSHPGGNITGLPGYNAAQTILRDLGLAGDGSPVPAARRIAELAA